MQRNSIQGVMHSVSALPQQPPKELLGDERIKRLREHVASALEIAGDVHGLNNPRNAKGAEAKALRVMCRRSRRNAARTAEAMRQCGTVPTVIELKDGIPRDVHMNQCRCAMCPSCAIFKAARARTRLTAVIDELIQKGHRFSLITLTIPHTKDDSLRTLVDALFESLRIFTRSVRFKRHVKDYARGIETVRGENGYHVHAHFIVDAAFWPKEEMKACWIKAVRNACDRIVAPNGVDVRGLTDVSKGLSEAIGYPFKAADLEGYSPAEIRDLWQVFKGRHLLQLCKAWGRRARELADANDAAAETIAAAEGVEFMLFSDLVRDIRRRKSHVRELGLAVLDLLRSKGLITAGKLLWSYMKGAAEMPRAVFSKYDDEEE